jgi:16S rRNA (guanine966-N2)-methyltransferase
VVFLDPPYSLPDATVQRVLTALRNGGWLAPRALVVVERGSRGPGLSWPEGLSAGRSKRYGETVLWYGHATAPDAGTR